VIVYREEDPPVPPHWFRPVKDRPADEKEKPLCKMKSLDNKRHYEIIPSQEQPSKDAKFLVDDDLVLE
jgi:hypothetical protein